MRRIEKCGCCRSTDARSRSSAFGKWWKRRRICEKLWLGAPYLPKTSRAERIEKMRTSINVLLALAVWCPVCVAKPNFVFFLIDDMGYMDIGANNPNTFYETPNIDRLANSGMRFTNGYAANPVCSPTRYSIMTGKYPSRVDATNFFAGKRPGRFMPAELSDRMPLVERTIAESLNGAGYRTAFLGKWHLGPTEEFWPENQGFEFNVGGHHRGSPPGGYFAPYKNPRLASGPDGEHLPVRIVDEGLRILDQVKDAPFLLYFAFYSVHTPLQAPKELIEKYKRKAAALGTQEEFAAEEQVWPVDRPRRVRIRQQHATYAAMVESMDVQIGRVLDRLAELGLDNETVVMLTSDNGGLSTSEGSPTSNLPLRGGKGWLYEGGIREPFLIRWPGESRPGAVSHTPVISTDFYPTILEMAELPPQPAQHQDGKSLVPLLQETGQLEARPLFWHYPHYSNQGGFPGGAIRVGDYKLIERFEDGRVHLYHIQNDIGEREDLAAKFPERVESMRKQLHNWYAEVDAKFLEPREDAGLKPWRPYAPQTHAAFIYQPRMTKHVSPFLFVLVATVAYASDKPLSAEAARYAAFASGVGDAINGKQVFLSEKATCSKCHAVGGTQRSAGPDLIGIGDKYSRKQLIEAVLQPNASLLTDYATTVVLTSAGETHLGILRKRNADEIQLLNDKGELLRIPMEEVEETEKSEVSLMPEQLHKQMTPEEFRDLISYLATLRLPKLDLAKEMQLAHNIKQLAEPVRLVPFHSPSMGFQLPVWFLPVPNRDNQFLVVEQRSDRIWRLTKSDNGDLKSLFLDLSDEVSSGQFEGLVCLALHSNFATNGKYYLNHNIRGPNNEFGDSDCRAAGTPRPVT